MKRLLQDRQRGAFAVAFAIFMIAIIGFISLSMDLSQVYVRQTEMQGAADAAAVAAARELDGTIDGINNARNKAHQVFSANSYSYWSPLPWTSEVMSFATTPDGPWLANGDVNAGNVDGLRFVRIDTAAGDPEPGVVQMTFSAGSAVSVRKVATAGPTAMQMIPLAACARGAEEESRITADGTLNELVQYTFRRGVTYNLLKLGPSGTDTYLVNPIDFPPAANNLSHFDRQYVGPFVCSGTMPFPRTKKLYVQAGFPSDLAAELNSRFEDYTANRCDIRGAAPDKNIRQYDGNAAGFWMTPKPEKTYVKRLSDPVTGEWRDVAAMSAAPDANDYGTLWAYARPVSYTSRLPFSRFNWPSLYPVTTGLPPSSTTPDSQKPPYFSSSTSAVAPSALRYRRVMGVPLVGCPVPASGEATVIAIAKFMLSAKAVDDPVSPAVAAEFGGLLEEGGLAISAGLYK